MLKISRKSIDNILEANYKMHMEGRLIDYQLTLTKRIAEECPVLSIFIDKGEIIMGEEDNTDYMAKDERKIFLASYKSGAHLTFRMLEEEVKTNQGKLPEVKIKDIEKVNERGQFMGSTYKNNATIRELERIKEENPLFGSYVTNYVKEGAPLEIMARGFILGVITTYSVFEQAFKRLNNN